MNIKFNNKNLYIDKKMIIILYLIVVVIAKIVRYTVMKETLVDQARGYSILDDILYNKNLHFAFTDLESSLAFNNAAVIFRTINLFSLNTYLQFEIFITIIWNLLIIKLILGLENFKDNIKGLYLVLTIAVLNIFNFTLAKEPIQILYFLMIYAILCSKIKENYKFLASLAIVLLSTITFRNYYVLIASFAIASYFVFAFINSGKKRISVIKIISIVLSIIFIYFVFLTLAQRLSPSSYNELIWLKNHSEVNPAATQIYNFLPNATSNNLMLSLEYTITAIRLLLPFEILLKGPKYFIFAVYQILVTATLVKGIINHGKNAKISNYALYLYLGFLLASVTFEPDFGSWVRHESVAFPLLILIQGLRTKAMVRREEKKETTV